MTVKFGALRHTVRLTCHSGQDLESEREAQGMGGHFGAGATASLLPWPECTQASVTETE